MYRLHGFSQSGNTFKIAFALRALQQPWEPVLVDFMNGQTRTPAWREGVNEMGEVPVLEDNTLRLTQSAVILLHLARKHGAVGGVADGVVDGVAWAGASESDQQEVLRWLFFDNHKFTSYFATYRFMKAFAPVAPDPAVMAWLRLRLDNAFGVLDKHLLGRDYIVGGEPTIADLSCCGYLFYPVEESGYEVVGRFDNIAAWLQRVRAIEGWAAPYDILPGARIAPRW